ncbi:MBL fold metallo-hydrolase [Pyxidicoccus parkwayensis]|uniref:MBL fold metallo-hydrolase n=1 Tax=Pyxidicoccus parkwayensis TaxID=2813578 RepID=A0ABX7PAM5_9BACT|nr:MBL fold metallo-hydrolase [Pyxidicoccus parkwaysis]QSQ27486.1 MBL fold metallo-hydrolase [Pyxidicoccus parkwaysis]
MLLGKMGLIAAMVSLLAACAGGAAGGAPEAPPSGKPAGDGTLRWFGGPTVLLERGGVRLMTDPMLGPRGPHAFVLPKHPSTGAPNADITRYVDPPEVPLGRLDAVILSHGHADHFDARAKELLPKDTLLIVAPASEANVRKAGFTNVRALDWGQSTVLEAGGSRVRVTAVPAHHSHDSALDTELGKGNGYVLAWEGDSPYVVYWTGDAMLSEELRQLPAQLGAVDLFLPHLGGVGGDGPLGLRTMDADEALQLMSLLRPRRTIPIHHTTFSHYREPVRALEQQAEKAGLGNGLQLPRDGEAIDLAR